MGLKNILKTSALALGLLSSALAAPSAVHERSDNSSSAAATSTWWFANIARNGEAAFNADPSTYKVYRDVTAYGAKGDGVTDDTEAINSAITDGTRCGVGCDSTTTTPALVYFPPGTYLVSAPIISYYYTHMVGDFNDPPTLKAAAAFAGAAVIDADPYNYDVSPAANWYTNQNNFFRQVRNFIIDLTDLPMTTGTGIHWQVAQATSLQNIVFNMIQDDSETNAQQGVFIDNGSGGYMNDLTFNGGKFGAWVGSQQFTCRNFVFNNVQTAFYMNWNWVWTLQGFEINSCGVGLDMTAGSPIQNVGSIVLVDTTISDTPIGVNTIYAPGQTGTNGTLILDNVDMSSNVPIAVKNAGTEATILEGNVVIDSWVQGRVYTEDGTGTAVQDTATAPSKPAALLDDAGKFVTKSKPQYGDVDASKFISVKGAGAKGDGSTDDTAAIQAVFDSIADDEIVYFDHGAYIITDTITTPASIKIVGEAWPLLMAGGSTSFQDETAPKPMLQVGKAGDVGTVEISDIILETQGPQPGAILLEFNVAGETKGAAGLFDVHARIGGSAGTKLQSDTCSKTPDVTTSADPNCVGAFLLVHVTKQASIYMENCWLWVSDHELDLDDHNQINIYNGRGILIEATAGSWLVGTAAEHSQMYNYELADAQNVYMGLIQTETAYMQGNPDATVPFTNNPTYFDPDYSTCSGDTCARTWGLRVENSTDIFVYGGGLYSFFNNYDQDCVATNNCQENMVGVDSSSGVHLYGITTKASVNIITQDGTSIALDADNRNDFGATVAAFETS